MNGSSIEVLGRRGGNHELRVRHLLLLARNVLSGEHALEPGTRIGQVAANVGQDTKAHPRPRAELAGRRIAGYLLRERLHRLVSFLRLCVLAELARDTPLLTEHPAAAKGVV